MTSWSFLYRLYTIIALIFYASDISAQLKYSLKHYSTEDGLSNDRVLCITKDNEGFMWFGTWDGINRFDGHDFIAYKARPGDSSNLKNNKIRNIIEDKRGYLWIKTYDNRVYRFDKKTEKFLSIQKVLLLNKFSNILIDKILPVSTGDTWCLTNKHGLFCFTGQESLAAPHIEYYGKNVTGENTICGNNINFIFEDSAKRIWIGTTTGLCCLVKNGVKYKKLYFENRQQSFGNEFNFTCVSEYNGIIYFGTDNGKLITYNTRSKALYTRDISKGTCINSLLFSKSNHLYASTSGKGLAIINPKDFSVIYASVKDNDSFYSLFEDQSGHLWIEPEKTGVIKYNLSTNSFKVFTQIIDPKISGQHTNYSILNGANGVTWISMKGGGFGHYDANKDDINYFYDEPLAVNQQFSNIITTFYVDPTGILWLSGHEGGIYRAIFQPSNFQHHLLVKNSKTKTENEVRAIFEDKSGKLWIGTKAGHLFVFKNGQRLDNVFINMPKTGIGNVYTILEGKNGTMWFGTKGSGLFKAEPLAGDNQKYTLTHYNTDPNNVNSLNNKNIYSVLEDSRGRVWIGTFGGGINLLVKDGNRTIFKNSNNSFKSYPIATNNVVRHLQEDAKGNIWVATTNGLVIFNPNQNAPNTYKFYSYNKVPGDSTSLANNDVQFIHKDKVGGMWIGTFGGGLDKLISRPDLHQKLKFKFFSTADGLPNDIILSIVDDNRGKLWLTTENGLSKYDPKTGTFHNYDYYDGLPNAKFSEAACLKSASGKILLGCLNGYVSFDPDKLYSTKFNANIALTNILLFNKNIISGINGSILKYPLDQTEQITLRYDQNLISINYTALDYRESHKILYAYKLDGLDNDWNYVKTQRQATYANLSPGKYVFRVKSVSSELFKNIPEKSITINILPPPWLTVWAYIVYCILVIILLEITRRIIFTMIRLRNKIVVEQKLTELKLQFFTNISHELKTPLTLILGPLEQIKKVENLSPKGREYINVVNKNADRMSRFINQLLDFRKGSERKNAVKNIRS